MASYSYNPYEQKVIGYEQQKKLAEQLRNQQIPEGQMIGGHYVAANPLSQLSAVLRSMTGSHMEEKAQKGIEATRAEQGQALKDWQSAMPTTKTEEMAGPYAPEQGIQAPTRTTKPTAEDYMAWGQQGMAIDPMAAQMGMQGANMQLTREANAQNMQARLLDAQQARQERFEQQKELQRMNLEGRRDLANVARALKGGGGDTWKYDSGSDTWVQPPNAQFPMGRSTPNVGKVSAFRNFEYLADKMLGAAPGEGILGKVPQGGWLGMGAITAPITNSADAKEFNNNVEQMSTELRKVFRIPGEGSLSDKEQAQYGVQLPKLGNPPELNRSIVEDLRVRMQNTVAPGNNPLQQAPVSAPRQMQQQPSPTGMNARSVLPQNKRPTVSNW